MRAFYIGFIFSYILVLNQSQAQIINNNGLDAFGNPILIDTTANENDTLINKNGFFSLFKGKPGRAALYALIIPSGGQIYNKKWWKVPLALGIDGGLTYVLLHNRSLYNETQALYQTSLLDPNGTGITSQLRQKRDFYRKWSEYAWLWLIAGHLFTVIDAYVDRHMMDFDVSPDLSLNNDLQIYNDYRMPFVINTGLKISFSKKQNKKPNSIYLSR